MYEISVNYVAVLLAGIAGTALGFLWYAPFLFGKKWMELKGYTKESLKAEQSKIGMLYFVSFLVSLVTAYVLYHTVSLSYFFYEYGALGSALSTGFFMWLGFIMPVQLTNQIFGEKKFKLFLIDTGYQLTSVLVMGIVISLFL